MIIPSDILEKYNNTRFNTDKSIVCHAPTVKLNFEQNGTVRACCYNTVHILGNWPAQSIKEIWTGDKITELREYIAKNDLGDGCSICGKMLESGNYQGAKSRYYDEFLPNRIHNRAMRYISSLQNNFIYPKVMEFELSNTCNLECVMCNGYFSSSIRKNREHLPPMVSPYDDRFVDQLEEFIPHLTDAKFLGGEPFMIDIYIKIWERIRKINPGVRIHITTNGTFLNERIKELLEGLKVGIIVSIDTIVPDTYKSIRVNGNLSKVLENVEYFRQYTRRKRTFMSIAACPMTNNWREIPQLMDFCLQRGIAMFLNIVYYPRELSFEDKSPEYLDEMVRFLSDHPAPPTKSAGESAHNLTVRAYNGFARMVEGWHKESIVREKNARIARLIEERFTKEYDPTREISWSLDEIRKYIDLMGQMEMTGYIEQDVAFQKYLSELFVLTPEGKVLELIKCYLEWYDMKHSGILLQTLTPKLAFMAEAVESHPHRSHILAEISKTSPVQFAMDMEKRDEGQMLLDMRKHFG